MFVFKILWWIALKVFEDMQRGKAYAYFIYKLAVRLKAWRFMR